LEGVYPAAYQLALDMLKRLSTANDLIVEILINKQKIIPALRYKNTRKYIICIVGIFLYTICSFIHLIPGLFKVVKVRTISQLESFWMLQ
jgi:hypothetical protein